MRVEEICGVGEITELAKRRFAQERSYDYLKGWFLAKEIQMNCGELWKQEAESIRTAKTLVAMAEQLPLEISDYNLFAGTQNDAFARSYALINPTFEVETFAGYCDPLAVFGDIEPNDDITKERIEKVKAFHGQSDYVSDLKKAYKIAGKQAEEVVFFIEQVTGHLIPDVRGLLEKGVKGAKEEITHKLQTKISQKKRDNYKAMDIALDAVVVLANRYAELAKEKRKAAPEGEKNRYILMENTLKKVPNEGASNLYEAIQSFILIWQVMCVEQVPNPFAFSVGNADRIFEPYRAKEDTDRKVAKGMFEHLLVFFNVADRSWAISQNLMVGGKSSEGEDLTNPTTYALLDAYFEMNLPQPILSVKLHENTPKELYEALGKFFFSAGMLTPSLFNDDAVFEMLEKEGGIDREDLEDYSIAGCQEPLIMGKDNGNTTNSWLNLGKILELSINDGVSMITGERLGESKGFTSKTEVLQNIRSIFYENLERYVDQMIESANQAIEAVSNLQVPFLSTMMGGLESGIDTRDVEEQGTKYNGSGCLIHGLSVVADSFVAIDEWLKNHPERADELIVALQNNFVDAKAIQQELLSYPKFGNNIKVADAEAVEIAERVSTLITSKKNSLGNPFRADWASPSTHLLYGYWVGATPDGRNAREQLGYGIDPLFGEANQGLGFRILSHMKLPYEKMTGGYASHLGIDPKYFTGTTLEEKGLEYRDKIMKPLFFNKENDKIAPYYLYVNVTTPETLKKVLCNPKKYAPSGVYIMRIHGTFVNFLDLSPAIQQDIIKRLDLESTSL